MDRFIICARVLLITFAEDLRILVGQECKPWDLPLGMREISCFTSSGMTKSKANEVVGVSDAFKKSRAELSWR